MIQWFERNSYIAKSAMKSGWKQNFSYLSVSGSVTETRCANGSK